MKRVAAAVIIVAVAALGWSRIRASSIAQHVATSAVLRRQGQWSNAEKELDGLPAEVLEVQVERAELHLAQGHLPKAYDLLLAEAGHAGPADTHFWARYGFMAALMGKLDDAKASLERAAVGSPAEPEAATHLVQLIQRDDPAHAAEKCAALERQASEPPSKAVFHAATTAPGP